jgi:hypothetical protein
LDAGDLEPRPQLIEGVAFDRARPLGGQVQPPSDLEQRFLGLVESEAVADHLALAPVQLRDRAPHELGLPSDSARPLWMMMRRREPDERPFAHPTEWAAFAHVGV